MTPMASVKPDRIHWVAESLVASAEWMEGKRLLTELTWSNDIMSEISKTARIMLRSYFRSLPGTVKNRVFIASFPMESSRGDRGEPR